MSATSVRSATRARSRAAGENLHQPPSALSPPGKQVALAQQLYEAGDHTVQQIADLFSVPRTTVYGHLDDASEGKRPASQRKPKSSADASGN